MVMENSTSLRFSDVYIKQLPIKFSLVLISSKPNVADRKIYQDILEY